MLETIATPLPLRVHIATAVLTSLAYGTMQVSVTSLAKELIQKH